MALEDPSSVDVETRTPDQTRALGEVLGRFARPGYVYLLSGELGAGKSTLTQGVLNGLGSEEQARSPTFVIVAEYPGRLPVYHVDLYRIESGAELDALGLDEYVGGDGLCVVEWADRASGYFGEDCLSVSMTHLNGDGRRLVFASHDARYGRVLAEIGGVVAARTER